MEGDARVKECGKIWWREGSEVCAKRCVMHQLEGLPGAKRWIHEEMRYHCK